jgi:hypothetical protein
MLCPRAVSSAYCYIFYKLQTCQPQQNLHPQHLSTIPTILQYYSQTATHAISSPKLQTNPDAVQEWLKKWRIKANESKLIHVTFTTRRGTCPSVHVNSVHLSQQEDVKCLGLHLDRRHKPIFTKRKQLGTTLSKTHWLLGRK